MSKQEYDQVLFPVRITQAFKDELAKMAEEAGLSMSDLVRCSIEVVLREPSSLLHDIMEKWKRENNDGQKEGAKGNNGQK